MQIETEKKGVFRNTHSRGLTFKRDEAYQQYLKEREAGNRLSMLEDKMDRILELMEKQNGTT